MEVAVSVVLTVVGLVMLCFGGNWLVNGGVNIAKKFKGFFRITDGEDTFRYKELQTVTITTIADTEKHYSDD
ncbi:MAG: hypothetical protein QQN45_06860, partial [Nitrosopumilus sp.]